MSSVFTMFVVFFFFVSPLSRHSADGRITIIRLLPVSIVFVKTSIITFNLGGYEIIREHIYSYKRARKFNRRASLFFVILRTYIKRTNKRPDAPRIKRKKKSTKDRGGRKKHKKKKNLYAQVARTARVPQYSERLRGRFFS